MNEIVRITARKVTPALRALFDTDQPLAIRCFAVFDDSILGRIWTDDPVRPSWVAVQESAYDTLFVGGQANAKEVYQLIETLKQESGAEMALGSDHYYNQLLPPNPDVAEWELEFTNRPLGIDPLPNIVIPEGCELLPIDATWFERCRYRDNCIAFFGSVERTLEKGFGICLVKGEALLAEAFAAASSLGMIEIGTITGEPYRRRGHAAICCAQLIKMCEARGYQNVRGKGLSKCARQGVTGPIGTVLETILPLLS